MPRPQLAGRLKGLASLGPGCREMSPETIWEVRLKRFMRCHFVQKNIAGLATPFAEISMK